MKKKIFIGVIIVLVVFTSIFVIFTLGKKDGKTIIPVSSSSTSSTSIETSEVITETTTLATEEVSTALTTKTLETTKKTTTKKQTTTLDCKIVKEIKTVEYTKYGTVIKENYEVSYKVYNDGRKEEKSKKKKSTNIDSTNYKATTDDLKEEALTVRSSNRGTYNEMLSYVNKYRSEVNVSLLSMDDDLNLAATIRAIEMAYSKKFSHFRPDGNMCYSVIGDLDISARSLGENVAYGQKTAAAVSEVWKNSTSGHYENMVNAMFTRVGFGKFTLNGKTYWVQMFAG